MPPEALARFLPAWQGLGTAAGRGVDGLLRAIEQLQGAAVPASALESLVLPARVADYSPAMLDELTAPGRGALGRPGLAARQRRLGVAAPGRQRRPAAAAARPTSRRRRPCTTRSSTRSTVAAALFFRSLSDRIGATDDGALAAALWDLVWAGLVTNDTLAPLRALLGAGGKARAPPAGRRPPAAGRGRARRPAMPTRSRAADRGRALVAAARARDRPDPARARRWPRRCSTGTAS